MMSRRGPVILGSARVPRADDGVLAIANFFCLLELSVGAESEEVRFGATPKPTRDTRVLPGLPVNTSVGSPATKTLITDD
jgi:hypothetical protein